MCQCLLQNNNNTAAAGPLDVEAEVASQVLTLVGDLAGEGKSQPEPCTVRCDEHYFLVCGRVCV